MDEATNRSMTGERSEPVQESVLAWIDTHCHLDATEFDADRDAVVGAATDRGVSTIVIPAVNPGNFAAVRALAHRSPGGAYALGIHPIHVLDCPREAIEELDAAVREALLDDRFVAIGEIGLDFFIATLKTDEARALQFWFFVEQLKVARRYDLPVLLHVRKSQDMILKGLRQVGVAGGIAHAFNGSDQQARFFVELGLCLGFGGAMTFERSLQIRHLAQTVPQSALVLETDAPDISPAWLYGSRNAPAELPRIAAVLAGLRSWDLAMTSECTCANSHAALPRLLLPAGNGVR